MNRYSHNDNLTTFEFGERRYYETTLERSAHDMRALNAPPSRRPKMIEGWEFTASLLTAVGTRAGDVRYIICLERVN